METKISFDEQAINENARMLLAAVREQNRLMVWENENTTSVVISDTEDSDDVLSIMVDDQLTWSERARKFGLSGLDPVNRSGEFGPQGAPIPNEEYLQRVAAAFGDEKNPRHFDVPDRIVRAVKAGKISGLEAINQIGDDFARFINDGEFSPRRSPGRPTLSGQKMRMYSVLLDTKQIDWLRSSGNASETIRALIDAAMKK